MPAASSRPLVLRALPEGGGDAGALRVDLYGQTCDSSTSAMDESTGGAVNLTPAVIFGIDSSGISAGQVEMEWEDDFW